MPTQRPRLTRPISLKLYKYLEWTSPGGETFFVNMPCGFKDSPLGGEAGSIARAKSMIMHIVEGGEIITAYSLDEIELAFNEWILAKYGETLSEKDDTPVKTGYYHSETGNPKETMNRPEPWGDLLNNLTTGLMTNFAYFQACTEEDVVPQDVLDETMPDIQKALGLLKVVEDWVYYNRGFMRKVFGV